MCWQMWGAVVRNAREWVRLTTVYFPEELQPEALAFIQVTHLCSAAGPAKDQWPSVPLRTGSRQYSDPVWCVCRHLPLY